MGTFLAARVMGRESAVTPALVRAWRAVAAGAPLGAAGTALWFAVMFIDGRRTTCGVSSARSRPSVAGRRGGRVGLIVAPVTVGASVRSGRLPEGLVELEAPKHEAPVHRDGDRGFVDSGVVFAVRYGALGFDAGLAGAGGP